MLPGEVHVAERLAARALVSFVPPLDAAFPFQRLHRRLEPLALYAARLRKLGGVLRASATHERLLHGLRVLLLRPSRAPLPFSPSLAGKPFGVLPRLPL